MKQRSEGGQLKQRSEGSQGFYLMVVNKTA